ncbi:hypothetical protein SEA_AMGINE_84 [Mycobacterium phage Amgine]|uniref:Uncharacterized protein n=1 Tax=Mycobacterium phage Amgine TaxID=2015817 RepID=A0A222ZLQ8_9CAUD|nr:hypothetical protein I5G84_gp84 [Mycobacterium phage Amgine]ASR85684.1 hypothetical protein SEA_AMGINE_84 [Mycobacterium phage Amgine]
MRRLIDRALRRLGYVRADQMISGSIEWSLGEQPHVDLKIPNGQRVWGWVDSRLPLMRVEDGLPLTRGAWDCDESGRAMSGASVCGTCDGGGCRDCIG